MSAELQVELPDVRELERQAEEFERRAEALRSMISAIRALTGETEGLLAHRSFESHRILFEIAPRDEDGPRGPQAVLEVMSQDPSRDWKVVDIKREMLRRGWAATPKAVEASVKRLRQLGRVVGTSYGHYRLA
jgi:hypothetical protein